MALFEEWETGFVQEDCCMRFSSSGERLDSTLKTVRKSRVYSQGVEWGLVG